MKLTSAKAKELLGKLNTTKVGGVIELPALMPGVTSHPIDAHMVESEDSHWTLECRWFGVNIGDVQASVRNGVLTLEVI